MAGARRDARAPPPTTCTAGLGSRRGGVVAGNVWLQLIEKLPNPVVEPEVHGVTNFRASRASEWGAAALLAALPQNVVLGVVRFFWPTARPTAVRTPWLLLREFNHGSWSPTAFNRSGLIRTELIHALLENSTGSISERTA